MQRTVYKLLKSRVLEKRKFIQVLIGPRQVGKTTLALSIEKELNIKTRYATADAVAIEDLPWLKSQWEIARLGAKDGSEFLLILDEIQKIADWSESIKKLYDEDTRNNLNIKVIILGSSPWLMQKGLTESLAGRFEIIPVTHWTYEEMHKAFDFTLDEYLYFGGYPGPALFAKQKEYDRWKQYINDSLVETTISRDILLMTQINKPILLRRLFQLGCQYSSQILSYTKMVGELQDVGNTTTVAHYLELLGGAGLLTGINKYSIQPFRTKGSIPKLQVYNTALISAQNNHSFEQAFLDHDYFGRVVESAVGAHLLNQVRGSTVELLYWRENNLEVDFVLKKGQNLTAIEVKSRAKKDAFLGIKEFEKKFHPQRSLVVGPNGLQLEEFLKCSINDLI